MTSADYTQRDPIGFQTPLSGLQGPTQAGSSNRTIPTSRSGAPTALSHPRSADTVLGYTRAASNDAPKGALKSIGNFLTQLFTNRTLSQFKEDFKKSSFGLGSAIALALGSVINTVAKAASLAISALVSGFVATVVTIATLGLAYVLCDSLFEDIAKLGAAVGGAIGGAVGSLGGALTDYALDSKSTEKRKELNADVALVGGHIGSFVGVIAGSFMRGVGRCFEAFS